MVRGAASPVEPWSLVRIGGFKVGDTIDIDLGRVVQKFVDQDRRVCDRRDVDGVGHVVGQLLFVGDDLHRPAAEHEAGADQHGITDFAGDLLGLIDAAGDAVGGLSKAQLLQQLAELFAVAGTVEAVDRGAEDGDAGLGQAAGEVEGGLSAELDDDAEDEAWIFARRTEPSGSAAGSSASLFDHRIRRNRRTGGRAARLRCGIERPAVHYRSQTFNTSSCVSGSKNSRSLVS